LEILMLWEETKISVPYSATNQVPGQRWSPKVKDWGCDNVLPGQGCRTSHGAVADEYGAVGE
jgi:hypothetical protein